MVRNVVTFLWRTLFVQPVCRHYVYTVFELVSVPLITYMWLYILNAEVQIGKEMKKEAVSLPPPTLPTHVVYGPDNEYNKKLVVTLYSVLQSLQQHHNQTVPLQRRPDAGFSFIHESVAKRQSPEDDAETHESNKQPVLGIFGEVKNASMKFYAEKTADTVVEKCRKVLEGNAEEDAKEDESNIHNKETLCISLPPPPPKAGVSSLMYTLFLPVDKLKTKKTTFPLGESFDMDRDIGRATSIQFALEKCHILLKALARGDSEDDNNITAAAIEGQNILLRNLPGWIFGTSPAPYRAEIFSFVRTAFFIPLIRRINAIEREFSAGLADHQGVMGLADVEYFFGHFLTILIICLVECGGMMAPLYYYSNADSFPWAHNMDPSLVAFSFLLFAVGFSLQIIMLTWIFPKGWTAVILAFLLESETPKLLTSAVGPTSLGGYFLTPRWEKLVAAVFPTHGLANVLRIIAISRDSENGGGWSIVTRYALERDTVTIVEIWGVMILTDLAMALLAWYFSKVLPWSTDNPQGPLFFIMPTYWRPSAAQTQDTIPEKGDPNRFEDLPDGTPTVIVANNLTKVYGYKPALNGLTMTVYESKITVLLGHNGAGKSTFMSILTGLQAPTSGVARVCGYNVTTNRSQVRQLVSFCQQTDIFFENMTCVENLLYFGSLKGVPMETLRQSIASTLQVVDLQDKAYSFPSELSGGMKRRLSIAITIVSEPKLLILDEPTSGMDPETRRTVWDTMQNVAKERTVLLSSHDMDEADAIGDQVVVMASGKVICSGSTSFLKKACGVGYRITLEKDPKTFDLKEVLATIAKAAPAAAVDEEKNEEVTIGLKTLDYSGFPDMFKALEGASRKLGIRNVGVSVATMKDVYLKINMDWTPEGKAKDTPVEQKDIDAVTVAVKKQRTLCGVFIALFIKRFLSLIRSWEIFLAYLVLPLVLLSLISWKIPVPSLRSLHDTESIDMVIPLSLSVHYRGHPIAFGESPATSISKRLQVLMESEGASIRKLMNVTKELGMMAKEDLIGYLSTYPMAVEFSNGSISLMQNPTSSISLPLLLNLVATSNLREAMADPVAHIYASIGFIQKPSFSPIFTILVNRFSVWFYWATGPAFTYTLGFAAYAAFPVPERLSGGRDVQLMTGMSGAAFVFAHFVFDLIYHAGFSGTWVLLHHSFAKYSMETAGSFYAAFLIAGPAAIGMAYVLAERAASVGGAVSSLLLWVFLGGILMGIIQVFASSLVSSDVIHYAILLFPPYALLSTLTKIWNADYQGIECELTQKIKQTSNFSRQARTLVTAGGAVFKAASDNKGPFFYDPCEASKLYSLTYDAIGFEIIALLAMGLVLLGVMAFNTSGYLPPGDAFAGKEVLADEDVEEEKKLIVSLRDAKDFSKNTMLAWNLHKRFKDLRAVRGVSLALRPSECFGLLGVNGAGKTTTFQMLSGLESVSYGDAMTNTMTLSMDARKWQSQISYCFQIGGLLDRLNAYEYLYLIGRLRGISNADLKPMIESILNVVDLKEHALKECGVYSGGNRRKLSIGAALLGLQPFIFLDEPYAGVDVVARNKIFRAIGEIKKRSPTSFMLTSHNMDECEFSCDRLTIMVNGQMMCLGTLQHLREKFGRGYRLEFLLKHAAIADAGRFEAAVEKQFPGIKLTEAHENVFCYHVEQRIPWSVLFSKLVQLQKDFQLEHALVGENTLEQIFLSFAKMSGVAGRPDMFPPQNVVPPPVNVQPPPSVPSSPSSIAQSTAKSVKKA